MSCQSLARVVGVLRAEVSFRVFDVIDDAGNMIVVKDVINQEVVVVKVVSSELNKNRILSLGAIHKGRPHPRGQEGSDARSRRSQIQNFTKIF